MLTDKHLQATQRLASSQDITLNIDDLIDTQHYQLRDQKKINIIKLAIQFLKVV